MVARSLLTLILAISSVLGWAGLAAAAPSSATRPVGTVQVTPVPSSTPTATPGQCAGNFDSLQSGVLPTPCIPIATCTPGFDTLSPNAPAAPTPCLRPSSTLPPLAPTVRTSPGTSASPTPACAARAGATPDPRCKVTDPGMQLPTPEQIGGTVVGALVGFFAWLARQLAWFVGLVLGGLAVFRMIVLGLWQHDSEHYRKGWQILRRVMLTVVVLLLFAQGIEQGWLTSKLREASSDIVETLPIESGQPSAQPTQRP